MADKPKSKGLGRGLSALLADVEDAPNRTDAGNNTSTAVDSRSDQLVPIEKVIPNPKQPRQDFAKSDLDDLANSIREKGIIQPLIVRRDPVKVDCYQIVAGERRWRAAQIAQVHDIPVLIRELSDLEVLELAIIENIQRADLNAVEEALGYRQLMDSFGHTQEKMAEALGKSRSHIANLLRLLNLPDDVLGLLREGKLSAGHARALVPAVNASELAKVIVSKGMSVRQAEALAKSPIQNSGNKIKSQRATKDADTRAIESDLSAQLGMKVEINQSSNKESGELKIKFKDLDQLDRLLQTLAQ